LLAGQAFLDIPFGVAVHTRPEKEGREPSHGGLDARVAGGGRGMELMEYG